MFGIVAVGTEGGHVYLVDLRTDDTTEEFTLSNPSPLLQMDPSLLSKVPAKRDKARASGKHAAVDLCGKILCSLLLGGG